MPHLRRSGRRENSLSKQKSVLGRSAPRLRNGRFVAFCVHFSRVLFVGLLFLGLDRGSSAQERPVIEARTDWGTQFYREWRELSSALGIEKAFAKTLWRSAYTPGLPAPDGLAGTVGAPSEENEVWLDGEGLRYQLSSDIAPIWQGVNWSEVFDRLLGVRLIRFEDRVRLKIYFTEAFSLIPQRRGEAGSPPESFRHGDWISLKLPRSVEFEVFVRNERVWLRCLAQAERKVPLLQVKLRYLPDFWSLHSASVSLANGELRVEVGTLGDRLRLVGSADLSAGRMNGLEFWTSVQRTLGLRDWDALQFKWDGAQRE
jgi:hypothetical protein